MTQPSLKIGPLPDRTPKKMTVAISPDLQADLADYAAVYRHTYGDEAAVSALIPHMLSTFLSSDAGFRRARKALRAQ